MKISYIFVDPDDIREYFETDPDMLESYNNNEFNRLIISIDFKNRYAEYVADNKLRDVAAVPDDYDNVFKFLSKHYGLFRAIEALEVLKNEHLLNSVGEALIEFLKTNPDSETADLLNLFYAQDNTKEIISHMATSSLVGNDIEQAIYDWIDETEEELFRREYLIE